MVLWIIGGTMIFGLLIIIFALLYIVGSAEETRRNAEIDKAYDELEKDDYSDLDCV